MIAKKRIGRPSKPPADKLSELVVLRMTKAEYRKLREKAKRAGLTVSEYLRRKD